MCLGTYLWKASGILSPYQINLSQTNLILEDAYIYHYWVESLYLVQLFGSTEQWIKEHSKKYFKCFKSKSTII